MEINSTRSVSRVPRSLMVAVLLLCLIGGARAEQPIVRDLGIRECRCGMENASLPHAEEWSAQQRNRGGCESG